MLFSFKVWPKQYPLWLYLVAAIIGAGNSVLFAWVATLMGSPRSVALQVLLVFGGLQFFFLVLVYFANKMQLRNRKSRALVRVVIAFAGAVSFATLYFHDRISPLRGSHTAKVQTDILSFVAIAISLLIASRISKNEGE